MRVFSFRRRVATLVSSLVVGMLAVSGCSVYDVPLPGGADVGNNPVTVKILFRDVLDLVPQSTVKVNDVTVGRVSKIDLKGYTAVVTVELPRNLQLPKNATASIRQTSLLGEKFVSLAPPSRPSSAHLGDNDTIGLDRTGRNPEVEEVLGALSLLLNGGGVGQLKTIAAELNTALDGREGDVRSVLDQIRSFMGQLDANKASVVAALENVNRLAIEVRKQDGTIKSALDDLPGALASIDKQRGDLVKLLQALTRLSDVGVKVISAAKVSTIDSLRDLAPVLEKLAEAGQNFPKSFQVLLTYPFVDEAVGRDPQVARNLHMGDFTNLSVRLDLDLGVLPLPSATVTLPPEVCNAVKEAQKLANTLVDALPPALFTPQAKAELKNALLAQITAKGCVVTLEDVRTYLAGLLYKLAPATLQGVCDTLKLTAVCDLLTNPTALPSLPLGIPSPVTDLFKGLGLARAGLNSSYQVPEPRDPFGLKARGYDAGIGTMLLQGVAWK